MNLFYIIDGEYKPILKFQVFMKECDQRGAAHPVFGFCGHRFAATAAQRETLPTEHHVRLPREMGRGIPGP